MLPVSMSIRGSSTRSWLMALSISSYSPGGRKLGAHAPGAA